MGSVPNNRIVLIHFHFTSGAKNVESHVTWSSVHCCNVGTTHIQFHSLGESPLVPMELDAIMICRTPCASWQRLEVLGSLGPMLWKQQL
jgi:hypothetical protein